MTDESQHKKFRGGSSKAVAFWIGGSAAVLAAVVYVMLTIAPQMLAVFLPEKWTKDAGAKMEASFVHHRPACSNALGKQALAALLQRLRETATQLPPVQVNVYNDPVVAAFTFPGGHIMLTRALIQSADTADEVAAVLAHEYGHAFHRDSEAQLVRITGLQILLGAASGGSSSGTAGSLTSTAAIMQSSRQAERDADAFAVKLLTAARIDPVALKTFLKKLLADESRRGVGGPSTFNDIFSTHPGTEERIKRVAPETKVENPQPALNADRWQDLRKICG